MKKSIIISVFSSVTLISLLTSCCKSDLKYTGVPSQIISVNQAIGMKQEYQNNTASLIEDGKSDIEHNYNATEYAYIELDSLKKYIAFIDHVQEKNKKQKITGIRFYFAAHTTANASRNVEKGRETLFLAPTMSYIPTRLNSLQANRKYLQNVPFSIVPNNSKDKYVGNFKVIDALLYTHDVGFGSQNTSTKRTTTTEETSLIMDDLYVCPPPKKPEQTN